MSVNSDLLLDPVTHDLDLSGLNLHIAQDSQATAQRLKVRLKLFKGEWFLDTTQGIPYYQNILLKAPDLNLARSTLRTAISTVPHVTSIKTFDFDLDSPTRTLTTNFSVTCDDADVIEQQLTLP